MLRRSAVRLLLASLAGAAAGTAESLDRFLNPETGVAILLDARTRRLIAVNGVASETGVSRTALAPPGSTLKPFVLAALLRRGKLRPDASFLCPTRLMIGNRRFDCTHPPMVTPMHVDSALAYSCNCFVAKMAERLDPGELARELESVGFAARSGLIGDGEISGRIRPAASLDDRRMQALGESGILITPLELALAYRQLALQAGARDMQPIRAGLEGAVEFGTAQNARVAGTTVAGKTGSTRSEAGNFIAWFAGFMPSRAPEVIVTVMLSGRSGGSDAAPVAGRILEAYRSGRLWKGSRA